MTYGIYIIRNGEHILLYVEQTAEAAQRSVVALSGAGHVVSVRISGKR